ncbi:MAG: four helix bundle protein [Desulfurellaceae bacterium]|nr:four helix bundle protein [Desulfurellaceae bacterium]
MHEYSFEKLVVWQKARDFVSFIYEITKNFPKEEKYGLVDQIRRASVSIAANLAEGSSRTSKKDQAHFTQLAYSSLMEVLSHFYIALDISYITKDTFVKIKNQSYDLSNLLNALRNSQLNKSTNEK